MKVSITLHYKTHLFIFCLLVTFKTVIIGYSIIDNIKKHNKYFWEPSVFLASSCDYKI